MKLNHKKATICLVVTLSGLLTSGFAETALQAVPTAGQISLTGEVNMQTSLEETLEKLPEMAELAAKTQEWYQKAVSAVDAEANVYEARTEDAAVVGKMYPNTIFSVEEKGEEWSRVSSGNVTGFVKNESLAFGVEAVGRAEEVCPKLAVPSHEEAKLFTEPKEDAEVEADMQDSYVVISEAEGADEEWIAVQDEAQNELYIKKAHAELVRVSQEAKTVEEIAEEEAARKAAEEARRKEEERKAAEEAAKNAAAASSNEQSLLAALIYCEAGGEPYEGQVAVGAVVLNRVRSASYPNSIREVIYQSGQFGPAITGKLDRVLASGKTTASCYQAAADALAGVNPIGSALYFGCGNYGQQIGGHWFH